MNLFNEEVSAKKATLPKPKGAFGRRHISRGLRGFHDAKAAGKRKHRPAEEFIGYRLMEKLLEMGEIEEAEKLFDKLSS